MTIAAASHDASPQLLWAEDGSPRSGRFGDVYFSARVGKRFVFGTGGLEKDWFPNVKTQSLEAGATVGYELTSMLDLVAGFDWLRYAFDFNPVPNPPREPSLVAGGAVDQYMSGFIGFRFHLPGKPEESATPAAPAPETESSEAAE